MFADNFTPVESEFWHTIDDVQYAAQAAENLAGEPRRVYYAVNQQWDNVQWFTEPEPIGIFIDVSHNNGVMDWEQAKSEGVTHAYIKASDGPDWHDPQFVANWAGAKAAGIQRGAYHFYRNYADPTPQAASFLQETRKAITASCRLLLTLKMTARRMPMIYGPGC